MNMSTCGFILRKEAAMKIVDGKAKESRGRLSPLFGFGAKCVLVWCGVLYDPHYGHASKRKIMQTKSCMHCRTFSCAYCASLRSTYRCTYSVEILCGKGCTVPQR